MQYRKLNTLMGWVAFAIAAITYLATMERTTSFWDCGEFIGCAYKLQVGHSPGAPFFMLLQRLFGMFATNGISAGPSTNAAAFMNALSALMSAGTILFLFWTITHFAKRILITDRSDEPTRGQTFLILGAGLVGALAYTFSDTFWFSAVEGEVYATSSFFTALTFWAMLKWDRVADQPHADRWIVFIAYLIGLSVSIHLLNLLTIPAIGLIYYFRRAKNPSTRGAIIAFLISCGILGFVQFGVLQGLPVLASKFEMLFVNSFGLPFDTGSLFFIAVLVAALAGGLAYARKRKSYVGHLATLCSIFIVIGFSSYMIAVIRSRADVPIDMTNPDNTFSLTSYLAREQFGQQPLMYGPDFDAGVVAFEKDGDEWLPVQKDGKDHYADVGDKPKYVFDSDKQRFFPRMWSSQDPHPRAYRDFLGLAEGERPTSGDNMRFFMGYHMNWMWWRYFMWNYAGRQNDYQGLGNPRDGNWISGIGFVDKMMGRGDMDKMPDGFKNNRARNELFFLPLILGILGLIHQFNRRKLDGWVVFALFFFTGIAEVLFLNMTPLQPRERDYAFAGSTYCFAIWIGLGVMMLADFFRRSIKGPAADYAAVGLSLLAVPVLMAAQNRDDHDRSNRTLALDTAKNTLGSCAPNAVLFTFGDNETYPLWYVQEVEGYRKDVRVINTSLLGIGWYIDQLNYRINDAMPVPMAWSREGYIGDHRNFIQYSDNPQIPKDKFFPLDEVVKFYSSDDPANQLPTSDGRKLNYLPSKNIVVPAADAATLQSLGYAGGSDSMGITASPGEMRFTIGKDLLVKDELAQLAILAQVAKEGWKRPIYYSSLQELGAFGNLRDYLKLEGTVYRVMPFKPAIPQQPSMTGEGGHLDVDKTLDLFMNKYTYGGAERTNAYFDEKNRIMFAPYRINVSRLADELTARGRQADAIKVLDKVMAGISERSAPYDGASLYMAVSYLRAGAKDKAKSLMNKIVRNADNEVTWALTLGDDGRDAMAGEIQRDLTIVNILAQSAQQLGDAALATELQGKLQAMFDRARAGVNLPMGPQ